VCIVSVEGPETRKFEYHCFSYVDDVFVQSEMAA
jgi:hypothetical protein